MITIMCKNIMKMKNVYIKKYSAVFSYSFVDKVKSHLLAQQNHLLIPAQLDAIQYSIYATSNMY